MPVADVVTVEIDTYGLAGQLAAVNHSSYEEARFCSKISGLCRRLTHLCC